MPESTGISLAQFRERQTRDAVLPNSRLAVKMRANLTLLDLAAEGLISQTLLDIALGTDEKKDDQTRIHRYFEKLPEILPGLNTIFKTTIISPPIADEPDDEHLGIGEIPFADKIWVFTQMNEGAEQLAPFRQKQDESAATGPGSD